MSHVSKEAYARIDNDLYNRQSDIWWNPNEVLYLLKTSVNPVRVEYARRKILGDLKWNPHGRKALEVGSGGES